MNYSHATDSTIIHLRDTLSIRVYIFSLLLLVFDTLEIQLVLVVGSRNKVVGFKARCIISWLIKGGEIVRQRIKFVSPFSVFEVIFT